MRRREGAQQCEALKQAKEAVPAAQLHKHVHHPGSAAKPSPHGPSRFAQTLSSETTNEAEFSYEISPYKSESESEEDEENPKPKKSIPQWAQSLNVLRALQAQQHKDPDEIFQQKHIKTCNLEEMFHEVTAVASSGGNGKRSHGRRGSSGNWIEDRVTWQEELAYKKNMGFRAFC